MYSILELKTKNGVGVERSYMVVTKVRSMDRQLRPLKAENQLQGVEWVASGTVH